MDWENFFEKLAIRLGIPLVVLIVLGLLFRVTCVNFVDNYEFGYEYNKWTGELSPLHKQGYIVTWPFVVSIHTIDTRPTQVCINANSRVLNCKLVEFDTTGWRTFVGWHGRDDYSNNSSNGQGGGGGGNLNAILMSYAYDGSGKAYPFLKVLRELKPDDEVIDTSKTKAKIDTTK